MSKYYKAEDIDNAIREAHAEAESNEIGEAMFHLHGVVSDLPTIEVSEEVLKATKKFNCYTIADENAEMGMRTQIEPIIEVSEDCISRAEALDEFKKDYDDIVDLMIAIEELPSVVPTTEQSSTVGEWIPCSKRLPSELGDDERVLVTTEVDGLGVILMPAYDVKSWYLKGYITAWMHQPEPWKGADDDN